MAPLLQDDLPVGDEWKYQLKWDGVRVIAVNRFGKVTLYSKNMQILNHSFPELVNYLQQIRINCILDGEAVVIEPTKQHPDFHSILKRLRYKKNAAPGLAIQQLPVTYALFDIISIRDKDLRSSKLTDRFAQLQELFPNRMEQCLVTDLFDHGEALLEWVKQHQWEGVVCKKANSLYREGKNHADWFKTKIMQTFAVKVVGYTVNEGRLASLVMTLDDIYCGKVSAGLNQKIKKQILELKTIAAISSIPLELPKDITPSNICWLTNPLVAVVTSLDITDQGILRHPKIVDLRRMDR